VRKKVKERIPMANAPGTFYLVYEDDSTGIERPEGVRSPDNPLAQDQGRSGMPIEWNGESMDAEPASHSELNDIESALERMRPLLPDDSPIAQELQKKKRGT
jgi:hypothetical protein